MTELPPELEPRRDAIRDLVVKRGTAQRRRRRLTLTTIVVVVFGAPFAVAGAITMGEAETRQVQAVSPTTLEPPTTIATEVATSTTEPTSTSTTTPPPTTIAEVPTTNTEPTPPPVTVTTPTEPPLVCRNSKDPRCGEKYWDPPPTNEPATLTVVEVEPAKPKPGQKVVFRLHAKDPDSFVYSHEFCGDAAFGDGRVGGCQVACAQPLPFEYGAWDPPPPSPSDVTVSIDHLYAEAGTYKARFTIVAGQCSPRVSKASTTVTVHVAAE